ncbi:MAG TPA: amylo-alpha-1,6-glucosidase [Thermoanaerobaculia bacterium]|nr:amylo-alpha-1,6-glucosidase [Thermoanaerobaculia bacterium]
MQSFPLQPGWKRGDGVDALVEREWLVTNGLGGYASGTIGGACTRRFHGKLIAALPSPRGRFMMLNHLEATLRLPGGETHREPDLLEEFVLEYGLPVWRYSRNGMRIEKRVVMPYLQNTTYIIYRLLEGPAGLTLNLRPSVRFRHHEGPLDGEIPDDWHVRGMGRELEIGDGSDLPPLRILVCGDGHFDQSERGERHLIFGLERARGYDSEGLIWSPGVISIALHPRQNSGIVASVEPWDVVRALSVDECWQAEAQRRSKLLAIAGTGRDNFSAQLVLAADQFLIRPGTRVADDARLRAAGDEPRTVIAGYHWFTDWGRDTMISLEGLAIVTGRHREAGNVLRTFASYIRDGLIPNMFPEGDNAGLYHTADATMWYFQAVRRYIDATGDDETLKVLLPKLVDIIDQHLQGTRFGIRVDPEDGLLTQGAEGYQLTWMDAKVEEWVVTPRRGKAVEINALYYNALRILQQFLIEAGDAATAERMNRLAEAARESFHRRFWYEEGRYLYDVVDAEHGGNDAALRPNQIFAISLEYPILDRSRWEDVVEAVRRELLTPVGLRSLAPGHPDYKPTYHGDLRTRDAAYHQGTVWGWLIGPFVDAWLRVHPEDRAGARRFLDGFKPHLGEAAIGTISEIFDAEPPFHPRGCAAQAWSVAEVLRCLKLVSS